MSSYEPVIGLEIHVQLKTKSKMFCSCSNDGENQPINTTVCPVCMGHPGTLPVPNKQAIEWSVMAARAIGCKVLEHSKFDRKSYFYPDLPKGYQISQYDEPIGVKGKLGTIGITRLHLEEDAAKLLHNAKESEVDFNRAGTPLMEIVTEPDIRSPEEAKTFLQELRLIMRYLGVSDADMEKGHLRCDANISLHKRGETKLYPKTEIKNVNSFRSVERALQFEIERQTELWEAGTPPDVQSTRGWDEGKGETIEQRTKEGASDYRYFPEPDIPVLEFSKDYVRNLEAQTPELPAARRKRFKKEYGLPDKDTEVLISDKGLGEKYEKVISECRIFSKGNPQTEKRFIELAANWLINRDDAKKINPQQLAELFNFFLTDVITGQVAQFILVSMVNTGKGSAEIIKNEGLTQVNDEGSILAFIESVIKENPKPVAEYKAGKTQVLKFLVGKVMALSKGKASAQKIEALLKEKLQ